MVSKMFTYRDLRYAFRGLNAPKPEHHQQLSIIPLTDASFILSAARRVWIDPVDEILESASLSID